MRNDNAEQIGYFALENYAVLLQKSSKNHKM